MGPGIQKMISNIACLNNNIVLEYLLFYAGVIPWFFSCVCMFYERSWVLLMVFASGPLVESCCWGTSCHAHPSNWSGKDCFYQKIHCEGTFLFVQNLIVIQMWHYTMVSCYHSVCVYYDMTTNSGHCRRTNGSCAGAQAANDFWSLDRSRSPHGTYRRTEDAFLLRRQKGCYGRQCVHG